MSNEGSQSTVQWSAPILALLCGIAAAIGWSANSAKTKWDANTGSLVCMNTAVHDVDNPSDVTLLMSFPERDNAARHVELSRKKSRVACGELFSSQLITARPGLYAVELQMTGVTSRSNSPLLYFCERAPKDSSQMVTDKEVCMPLYTASSEHGVVTYALTAFKPVRPSGAVTFSVEQKHKLVDKLAFP